MTVEKEDWEKIPARLWALPEHDVTDLIVGKDWDVVCETLPGVGFCALGKTGKGINRPEDMLHTLFGAISNECLPTEIGKSVALLVPPIQ